MPARTGFERNRPSPSATATRSASPPRMSASRGICTTGGVSAPNSATRAYMFGRSTPALVGEADAHLERARALIERRIDVVDRALPALARQRLEVHLGALAGRNRAGVALEDLRQHPQDGRGPPPRARGSRASRGCLRAPPDASPRRPPGRRCERCGAALRCRRARRFPALPCRARRGVPARRGARRRCRDPGRRGTRAAR